jgi:uncharacterized protein DUF4784
VSTPRASRRVGLLAALGVLAALALLAVFRRGSSAVVPTADREPPVAAVTAAAEPPPPSAPTLALGVTAAAGRRKAMLPEGGLARSAAEDYRRRARYPRSSSPLVTVDDDPIVRERVVNPIRSRGPNNEEPSLTVYPALVGFETPEPAVVHAFLASGDEKVAARSMRATVMTDRFEPAGELEYRDDGTEGDAVADDRVYTAVFVPGAEASGRPATSYMVRVVATTRGNEERIATTSFLYSFPDAQLTGAYRDAVVDGSLQVQAEVSVTAPGRFHLEATLYDTSGEQALAWAQTALALPEGRHWLTLSFYGLILRERGIDGPYVLQHVALSTASTMPNAKNRLAEGVHVTAAYAAARFTDASYDDPDLLDAADRVERDGGNLGGLDAGG